MRAVLDAFASTLRWGRRSRLGKLACARIFFFDREARPARLLWGMRGRKTVCWYREARTAEFIEKKRNRTSEAEKGMRYSDDDAVFLGELEEGGDGVQFALCGHECPPPAEIPLKTNPDLEKESFIV